MSWYRVVKTIKGHRYVYEQRTWREGNRVRTQSRYVGPAGAAETSTSVNTTREAAFDSAVIDEVIGELTRPHPLNYQWTHGWTASAQSEHIVEEVPAVDDLVRRFTIRQTAGTDACYFNRRTDIVNIPPKACFFDLPDESATQAYYGALLHELGHWTGHESRLNRRVFVFERESYAREELVAEGVAVLLMRHFGIAPAAVTRHAHYFQTWLGRTRNREASISYAAREIERAVRFLLGS